MSYRPFLNGMDVQSHLPSMSFPQQVDPRTAGLYLSSVGVPVSAAAAVAAAARGGVSQLGVANHNHHHRAMLASQSLQSSMAPTTVPPNPSLHMPLTSSSESHQRALSAPLVPSPAATPPRGTPQPGSGEPVQIRDEELLEDGESIRLSIDLPGVRAKDLRVQFKQGVLEVKAVRRLTGMDGVACVKKQKICRQYAIDCTVVDVSKVVADLDHGVLVITAPKGKAPNHPLKRKQETDSTAKQPEVRNSADSHSQIVTISP